MRSVGPVEPTWPEPEAVGLLAALGEGDRGLKLADRIRVRAGPDTGAGPPLQEVKREQDRKEEEEKRGLSEEQRLRADRFFEHQDVLPRQLVADACQLEAFGLDFELRFGDGHLVLEADRDRRVFFLVLE